MVARRGQFIELAWKIFLVLRADCRGFNLLEALIATTYSMQSEIVPCDAGLMLQPHALH
jgi:hypothetical protein